MNNLFRSLKVVMLSTLTCMFSVCDGQVLRPELETTPLDQLIDSLWTAPYYSTDLGASLARLMMRRARSENNSNAYINGLQGLGEWNYVKLRLDSASHYYALAGEEAERVDNQRELGHINVSLASLARDRGDESDALAYTEKAIRIWKELGDNFQLCNAMVRKGGVHLEFDRLKEGMSTLVSAMDICEAANDRVHIGYIYNGLSTIHKKQHNLDKAIEMCDSALTIYRQLNNEWQVAITLNNYGILMKDVGRYDEAPQGL